MAITHEQTAVLPIDARTNAEGRLEVGGCDAVELAKEFGTPAFVVSEQDLRSRANAYLNAFERSGHEAFDVLFASKAFPSRAVFRTLADVGLACDAASAGELALALDAGMDADRIFLHGNAKTDVDLVYAMSRGVGYIVLDSFDEIDRLERLADSRQQVLIRVTPGIKPTTHSYISTGQLDSKFGFNVDDAREAISRLTRSENLDLVGLHAHIGSQIMRLDAFAKTVEALAALGDFPVYNLGGGLGVAYLDGQVPPSIDEYVQQKVQAVHRHLGSDKKIVIEPGRSIVANAGVTLYSIVAIKRNVSTYVAVDGGMSDNLRPMLYGARYQAMIADRIEATPDTDCHLVGKHCESGDVLVKNARLNAPRVGDIVATPATGAYGHAMANNYNAMLRPPVVFCRDGNAELVVRRETLDDLAARELV